MEMQNETPKTDAPATNFRYRDENGKMISKEIAIQKRWAHKEDGSPTKIYLHRQTVREALKNGLPVPKRAKKTYEPGSQTHNGIASPYDLNRRSGYGVIWQVLAENVGQIVAFDVLTEEVNKRLKEVAPEWYTTRYSNENPYDVIANAYVMTRAPYNVKIEAMQQRVTQDDGGFKLSIDVAEPRQLKKRGRKLGSKNRPKAEVAVVTPDNDNAETIVTPETVEATA